ncbi:3-oxoacyl-[acyl-carrier-protein] reductase FabG [Geodia barretti]|uniref:3-oxoacyl-[acyl-carrier-protein] reductase n=1 Tax=Geodia barretti TaxID=519541 RepID=A0AA35R0S7_GEOBA|nr:3-oxoacyl-[acyl-carrier-protein] reductase FabG [Geodia barretti]
MTLKDKVAIVTGASRGIGEAIARKFCQEGASVMLCSRSESLSDESGNAKSAQADISNKADVEALVDLTLKEFDRVDILVNNAGITRDTLFMRMKDEDWDAVLQTNLTGTAYCMRAVIRSMMRQRSGRIINISSVVGVAGNAGQANYAASKAGIIGLTKSVAKEAGSRGITVNAITPGFITTDMTEKISEADQQKMLEMIPAGSFGTPEDVAELLCFWRQMPPDTLQGKPSKLTAVCLCK